MDQVIAVVGPPAVGKTTLTTRLGENQGCAVFRLREHVSPSALAAASVNPDRVDWIDDLTVARALKAYAEQVIAGNFVSTVLLDNFPGSALQVGLLLSIVGRQAPGCSVTAVELLADERVRQQRAARRRVCHTCEHDPARDPRLPAAASSSDPWRCARCGSILHPRRGDAPRLFSARTARFESEAALLPAVVGLHRPRRPRAPARAVTSPAAQAPSAAGQGGHAGAGLRRVSQRPAHGAGGPGRACVPRRPPSRGRGRGHRQASAGVVVPVSAASRRNGWRGAAALAAPQPLGSNRETDINCAASCHSDKRGDHGEK